VRESKKALVIGAGPAGLTAADALTKEGYYVTLLERDKVVGGLSKTLDYKGCRFDIGPHHFITNHPEIEREWKHLMGNDCLERKRFTRLYYRKKFFYYPLRPLNAIFGLGLWECITCTLSYFKAQLFPIKPVVTFRDFIVNRFGIRLFSHFFKTYTEKQWGISCDSITSEWASQRIKSFSLSKAIVQAFFARWVKKNTANEMFDAKSDIFYYPALGAGTLWDRFITQIPKKRLHLRLQEEVVSIEHDGNRLRAVMTHEVSSSKTSTSAYAQHLHTYPADSFFSTMPLRNLVLALDPCAPEAIIAAARRLVYRDLITVNLIIQKQALSPDHWLYIHDKDVRLARINNINNFSIKMVDAPDHTALTLEYPAFTGDALWASSDDVLIKHAKNDLEKIGIVPGKLVLDGMVLRSPEAYPVYDQQYKQNLTCVLDYLAHFENLFLMGRNGLHTYINMDVAMISARQAVNRAVAQHATCQTNKGHAASVM